MDNLWKRFNDWNNRWYVYSYRLTCGRAALRPGQEAAIHIAIMDIRYPHKDIRPLFEKSRLRYLRVVSKNLVSWIPGLLPGQL